MILAWAVFVVVTTATGALAAAQAEDLQPEPGVFASSFFDFGPYHRALRESLLGEHDRRHCQMVSLPSFSNEWAVYVVREEGDRASVVFKMMQKQLWVEMTREIQKTRKDGRIPLDPATQAAAVVRADRAVQRSVAPISRSTADLLDQVWAATLARVRYPPPSNVVMADGTTYYVAHWQQGIGERTGTTWSPAYNSNAGRLVAIAEWLRKFATADGGQRAAAETHVIEEAKELLERLKQQP